ncbi:Outer membrane cobalamin receptor protein [Luteitalea pratensis]|uniref:Outer membrane cobalamin receptor protein n=1 Tax=Luteitalea pratensis TaxID=1855912 RepID=A0A143PJT5_LUTPR|nr:Outer membrane cobalamin receptor protein [Luteitalea pratensis]
MFRVLSTAALALLLSTSAFGQLASQTGLIGTVTDSNGGVLPGATVLAINVGTQTKLAGVTNEAGVYQFNAVQLGSYEITITLQGFQTFKATNIVVGDNQVVRQDAVLSVGDLNETITVEASNTTIQTDRATVSQTVEARALTDLPSSGRNVWQMASTTPGVLRGLTTDIGLSFRGAGQREIQNSLTMDGINATSNLLAMTSTRPMADAVTEVTVQTGSTSAEYGAYLGVAVNVVTKSGTNGFHGALFEYFQGDKLESRGYFDNRNLPESPKKSNQFGAQFDGPVMIPGLYDGKNKTFFMGAYEGLRSNRQTSPLASVPTAKMRAGDFSEVSAQLRNPYTKVPYPGNIIPRSDIAAQALELLEYYPQPNLPGLANNYQTDVLTTNEYDQLLLRVDQNIGQSARVSWRYNWVDAFDGFGAAVPSTATYQPRTNKNTLLSYQQTLSPTLLNDFRIGWHRLDLDTVNNFHIDGNGTASSDLGIPGFDSDVRYDNFGIPTVSVTGFTGLGAAGTNWYQFDTTFQVSNVLSWNKGTHTLRAGIDLRKLRTGRLAANSPRGAFGFTSDMTGHAVADFMTGVPRTVGTPVDQLQGDVGQWRNGFFVNDVWQATQRMTLSLGLRYERNAPVQTYEGVASMLNADQTQIIPTTFPSPGFEFTEPNNKDWAPRLGATYRLSDKTVARAGWGIYYNPNQMNSYTFLTNNPPVSPEFTFTNDVNNPTLNFDRPLGTPGGATGPPNMTTPNRRMPNAKKNQWSLDLQHELFKNTVVELGYLSSHTENLDRSFYNNQPQPGPGALDPRRPNQLFRQIRTIQNDLIADYDAVTLTARRRMTNGFMLNAHYTWSKTRDMANHSNASGQTMDNFDIWRDYGPAIWDVPHRLVVSYLWDMPFFRTSDNLLLRGVLGGWQVGGVTTLQSGTPLNILVPGDPANVGFSIQRPNLVNADVELNCQENPNGLTLINCIDPAAFALPAQFTYGDTPRNYLRGPKYSQTDISLMKNFGTGGRSRIQVRAEVFNLFNQVNWGTPGLTLNTAAFGVISSTADTMRRAELGIKFLF